MSGEQIDDQLAKLLRAAKKKPLNFALVLRGANCEKLLLSKKPIKEKELLEAKKEVKGTAIVRGVVRGDSGPDMVFQVSELPSVQDAKFKKFLADQTGLTLKPRFEVVENLVEVNDESESGEEETSETPPAASAEPPSDADVRKLAEALKALVPLAQKVLATHPTRKEEILGPAAAIKSLLTQNKASEAREQLLAYTELLKRLAATGPADANKGVSLVALGKARVEWIRVRDTAIADIRRLRDAVADEFRDDEEQASQLRTALRILDQKIAELDNDLHEVLDAILNADVESRPPLVDAARKKQERLFEFLSADPVMAGIDDNEVIPGIRIRAPLEAQLHSISVALG